MTPNFREKRSAGGTRSTDADDKDALIQELKNRNLALENELQTRQDDIRAQLNQLRENNDALEGQVRELRQMAETLELMRFSMDQASDSIFWLRPDGRFDNVNRASIKLLGYSREELLQMSVWDIDTDTDMEKFRELWEDTRRHGSIVFETRVRAKDGTIYPVEVTGNCLVFGGREYVFAFIRDITERKREEEALRKNERYLESIFEGIQEGISLLDTDLNIVKVNRAMEKWYSHMLPLVGKKCYKAYQGRTEACLDCPSLRAMKEKTMQVSTVPYVDKSGVAGWMELYASPLLDNRGNVIGVIEHVRDVTERRRAEGAVKLANEYNRSLIEASLDPLVTISPEGVITDVNAATEKVTGYSRDDLIGTDFSCYFTEPEKAKEGYLKVFDVGSVMDYPLEIRHRNGQVTPVIYNASVYRDERGKVIGVFAAARDITARKRAEDGLKEAKAQAELYLDLMGHDIRNMNQISMGFLELVLGSPDISKHDKDLLLMSLGSIENSTRLIENVRKLQKARSGELKHYEIDACQTFIRVLAHFSNMPGVKASFNYELPSSCPVMANDLLYEVFENIVGNSIKHGGPEPVIDVGFDLVAAGGRTYNRFTVEDNGPGIPDELKIRIFSRLQRGNTKAKGMGLGLYLVKSLIDSYGGKVWAEDRVPGDHTKGAKFVVMLPAMEK
jgi:PAS domain S-box-containing protein